jgi:diguanylate cyclase (GGDEF)-like protein
MLDPKHSQALAEDRRMTTIQSRLSVAFLATYVAAMAAWALAWLTPGLAGAEPRLLVLFGTAILLPALMALLSRRVMRAIEALDAERVRLFEMYARARMDAMLDGLTGLGNHRAFQEELVRQLEAARRYEYPLALLLIDVDDLKRVNDQRGHAGGDELLATVGRILTAAQRRSDRAFRIGGDEFAVLLPHAELATAEGIARRVLSAAIGGGDHSRPIPPFSLSIGVSAFPTPSLEGHLLFRQTDMALYWAKRHGRTSVEAYDQVRHGSAADSQTTAQTIGALKQVLATHALQPVYQPIFSLETGDPVGYEALIRPGLDSDFASVTDLLAAAQAADRAVELDMACLAVIAAGCGPLDPNHFLSVNFSPATLEATGFAVSDVTSILHQHGIDPAQVVIELTEREAVGDVEQLRLNLRACQRAGMRIAADDVGSGNAGLRLLSEIRFDIVKIDLSLVHGGPTQESKHAVLRGLRELAVRSQAMVVAEGVESAPQLGVLRELGIDAGQGYLLGRPGSERQCGRIDLDALLAADDPFRRRVSAA